MYFPSWWLPTWMLFRSSHVFWSDEGGFLIVSVAIRMPFGSCAAEAFWSQLSGGRPPDDGRLITAIWSLLSFSGSCAAEAFWSHPSGGWPSDRRLIAAIWLLLGFFGSCAAEAFWSHPSGGGYPPDGWLIAAIWSLLGFDLWSQLYQFLTPLSVSQRFGRYLALTNDLSYTNSQRFGRYPALTYDLSYTNFFAPLSNAWYSSRISCAAHVSQCYSSSIEKCYVFCILHLPYGPYLEVQATVKNIRM